MTRSSPLVNGSVAGLAGAAVMAIWFLVIDVSAGQPLFTFRFAATLVFGSGSSVLVALYLALHFVLLAVIGAMVSYVFERLRIIPPILLGLALGLLLFDVTFYFGLLVLGTDVVRAVGWPVVLTGNVLAGLAIIGYLRVRAGQPLVGAQRALREHHVLREGLWTGLIGATAVAVWFLAVDVAYGRPLYTPAALGSAVFRGISDPGAIDISISMVAAYTIVHLLAFALIGLLAAQLAVSAEIHPHILFALVLLFVTLEVLSLGILAAVAAWLFETVPWWTIVIANLLGAIAMGSYLWRRHPALKQALRAPIEENLYRA